MHIYIYIYIYIHGDVVNGATSISLVSVAARLLE